MTLSLQIQIEKERRRRQVEREKSYATAVLEANAELRDPVSWITQNFYIPETEKPIDLYPSQIIPLREALSRLEDGRFKYSTVVWSSIKKSAKSSIAAAVGMWFAMRKPWSSVKVVANDLKQATSRVYEYMTRAIRLRPDWNDTIRISGTHIYFPNHSVIEAIPIDPKGEAGGNDDLVIFSELWGWNNKASQKMWTEMTLSPMKYGQSLRWCETYAGFSGESPILETLYENGVTNGICIDPENEIYVRDRLFVLWNTRPRLPWQTKEYYEQEASELSDVEFNRVHRNGWGASTGVFVHPEWWQNCKRPLPEYRRGESWVLALDAAISGDCFGMVAVARDGKGHSIVRFAKKWTAPPKGEIQYTAPEGTDPMTSDTPEGELYRLTRRHSIVEVPYDPYQLYSLCHSLSGKLVVWFNEFQQGAPRLEADKALYDDIRDGNIWHDGNFPDLDEHLMNANQQNENGKLRIVKRKETLKIDLAVCLSMANYEAKRLNI